MSGHRPQSDPEFLAAYGRAIASLRERHGMGRKELAASAGISYSYLSAIESGSKMPSPHLESAIAASLGVSPTELLATANGSIEDTGPTQVLADAVVAPDTPFVARMAAPLSEPERISPSGAHAELRVLLDQMSAEDAAALVAMARRLVDRNPVPQGQMRRQRRDSHWSGSAGRELRTATYLTFWTDYVNKVTNRGLDWVEGRTPEPRSYFTTASPIRGASLSASFARNRRIRHELYINRGSREANLELLDDLRSKRQIIERAYGRELDFEDPGQERRAVRIAEYREGHISYVDQHGDYVEWFIECGLSMRRAIQAYLKAKDSD